MGYLNQNFNIESFYIYRLFVYLKVTIKMSHKNYQQP
jgi:hypothetical protein